MGLKQLCDSGIVVREQVVSLGIVRLILATFKCLQSPSHFRTRIPRCAMSVAPTRRSWSTLFSSDQRARRLSVEVTIIRRAIRVTLPHLFELRHYTPAEKLNWENRRWSAVYFVMHKELKYYSSSAAPASVKSVMPPPSAPRTSYRFAIQSSLQAGHLAALKE